MIKKLLMVVSAGIFVMLGVHPVGAFFGPFRCLFPGPVGFNAFPVGGLQGCLGSFNWFSLPGSSLWPFCW